MQMSDIISQMQAMYKLQQTPGAEELLKETKRVLTDNYMFEETVLPTLPCSNAGFMHEPALQHQLGKSQHHVETDGEYENNKQQINNKQTSK